MPSTDAWRCACQYPVATSLSMQQYMWQKASRGKCWVAYWRSRPGFSCKLLNTCHVLPSATCIASSTMTWLLGTGMRTSKHPCWASRSVPPHTLAQKKSPDVISRNRSRGSDLEVRIGGKRDMPSNHYRTGEFHKFLRLRKYVNIMQGGSALLLHQHGTLRDGSLKTNLCMHLPNEAFSYHSSTFGTDWIGPPSSRQFLFFVDSTCETVHWVNPSINVHQCCTLLSTQHTHTISANCDYARVNAQWNCATSWTSARWTSTNAPVEASAMLRS